jgi:SAM-dependent methyltransferase
MSEITSHNINKLSHKITERLFILLNKFSKIDGKITSLISDKNNNDQTIIDEMKKNARFIANIPDDVKIRSAQKRAEQMAYHIKNLNIANKIETKNYLDIGCFDGTKTVAVGNAFKKILGYNKLNIFGVDVDNYAGVPIKPIDGFTFNRYEQNDVLPFDSDSFEIITLLQVLHHVHKPIKTLKEIKRVLKPGGLLFIREHDRTDKYIDKLIRLEHLLYSQIVNRVPYDIYKKNNYEKYF